jgi:ABC-2 type transport system ATP-binding protein
MEMSVASYLRFVAKIKGVHSSNLNNEVVRVMEKVNIVDVQDRIIAKLSKGYKQRVGIAQALLNDPPVLVLDEPTIGLDPKQIHEVRELIKELKGKHTMVLSTHILPEVEQTCNRVIIIDKGKIVAVDTPQNLRSQVQGADRISVEVEGPSSEVVSKLRNVSGVSAVKTVSQLDGRVRLQVESETKHDVRREVAKAIVQNGWGLLELHASTMSLEDIFIKLTTAETESTTNSEASETETVASEN